MILLDTHIVLATLGQTDLVLPPAIETEIRKRTPRCVSVATIWEIAIKYRLSKLQLSINVHELPRLLADINISVLAVQASHTLADISPEPPTKDPFDRLLLGVCAAERMKLLTIDRALMGHPLSWKP